MSRTAMKRTRTGARLPLDGSALSYLGGAIIEQSESSAGRMRIRILLTTIALFAERGYAVWAGMPARSVCVRRRFTTINRQRRHLVTDLVGDNDRVDLMVVTLANMNEWDRRRLVSVLNGPVR